VRAEGPDGQHTYRIIGRAAFPTFDSPQPLANGAALTAAGVAQLLSRADHQNGSAYLVVRVVPGARFAAIERRVGAMPNVERPFGPSVPVEVDRLRHVNWLAAALGALLAALALLAVGHALVTSVRRLRRDLAILKTLGFDHRQIRATVAWQASTLTSIGLVIGIPAGLIIGSVVWRLVANGLGVSPTTAIPTPALLLTIPCALVAVNLIAFFPGNAAARTQPAVALQSE
jgi:predicted lysophospholipase L1 biosynthesis ABC-type transport system permease subunit